METRYSKKPLNCLTILFLLAIPIFLFKTNIVLADTIPVKIAIEQLTPSPNYPLTSDHNDLMQLTDSKIARYPIWTSRDAVGWQNQTPIKIIMQISKPVSSGKLRLHTACGLVSGVSLPKWIDIYSQTNNGWNHIATTATTTNASCQMDYWLEIDLNNIHNKLEIIAHANGEYLFFDEIELLPSSPAVSDQSPSPLSNTMSQGDNDILTKNINFGAVKISGQSIAESDLINDSVKRLKASALQASVNATHAETMAKRKLVAINEPLIIWNQDPWAPAYSWASATSSSSPITLRGTDTETQTLCIGLLPPQSFNARSMYISETTPIQGAISYRKLNAVLAANGMNVYDRLSPIVNHTVQLEAYEPTYLWVDVNLAKFGRGEHTLTLQLGDPSNNQTLAKLTIILDVIRAGTAAKSPHVLNWSYQDGKLWNDVNATLTELLSGGTDTFVIPSEEIPGAQLNGHWDKETEKKFDSRVQLYRDHGQILLFLNWKNTLNPLSSNKFSNNREAYLRWLGKITKKLQNLGVSTNQWMLYPIDEPNDNDWASLEQIVNLTNQYNSNVRFYTNIIPGSLSQIPTLARLASHVSVWQPKLSYLQSSSGYLFSHLPLSAMWIYEVPPAPAKTAPPIKYYRSLAWQAYKYGAAGIGFWSFSDVGNSSARDDFDGIRPDWAVIYEGDNDQDIQSSRRWEAFKQGLQDYRLLISSGIDKTLINDPSEYSSADIQIIRKQALDILRRQQR